MGFNFWRIANGLRESDLTRGFPGFLKEELESYDGASPSHDSRDGCPSVRKPQLASIPSSRVDTAVAADADALVSIHFNSARLSRTARKSLVREPPSYNYWTHTQGRTLSSN